MRLEAHRHQGLGAQICLKDCSPTSDEILYSSEMAQPLGSGDSFIFPQGLWKLVRAVEAERLTVKTVIGVHMSPTPWQKVIEAVSKASRS